MADEFEKLVNYLQNRTLEDLIQTSLNASWKPLGVVDSWKTGWRRSFRVCIGGWYSCSFNRIFVSGERNILCGVREP
jgi:hypothetical protein